MSDSKPLPSAYGGPGWSPRVSSLGEEIGTLWGGCGVSTEWGRLERVLLHRPGNELDRAPKPRAAQWLAPVDPVQARRQHDALAAAYRAEGVEVVLVEPPEEPPPNLMFAADLFLMTPEGAVVGRPASTVRAGEERWVARRLAELGIPILRTVRGTGTFEGADALWIGPSTVMLATGLRTNEEGARQVEATLGEQGVRVERVELAPGTMHLMGSVRILDRDLAVLWPGRAPERAGTILERLNVVTVAPRRIIIPAGNPVMHAFYQKLGVHCREVEVDELGKAAGGIACMSGVLRRSAGASETAVGG